jgi:hypothetical protein
MKRQIAALAILRRTCPFKKLLTWSINSNRYFAPELSEKTERSCQSFHLNLGSTFLSYTAQLLPSACCTSGETHFRPFRAGRRRRAQHW